WCMPPGGAAGETARRWRPVRSPALTPGPLPAQSGAGSPPRAPAAPARVQHPEKDPALYLLFIGFTAQQRRFTGRAPAVARESAVATHHPVAGDNNRQPVGGTGPGHRPHRTGMTYGVGHLLIARGLPARNGTQSLPDLTLEGCTANIQWQGQCHGVIIH